MEHRVEDQLEGRPRLRAEVHLRAVGDDVTLAHAEHEMLAWSFRYSSPNSQPLCSGDPGQKNSEVGFATRWTALCATPSAARRG